MRSTDSRRNEIPGPCAYELRIGKIIVRYEASTPKQLAEIVEKLEGGTDGEE